MSRVFCLLLISGGLPGVLPGMPPGSPVRDWDPSSGRNIKWVVELGSYSYGGPVVADGRIYVGTNNDSPRDPSIVGDRGVLMALREADGELLWQATHDKLSPEEDYPQQGVCSTPAVDGARLYYVSNRGELVCLDSEGFSDGQNDGPWTSEVEAEHAADIVWRLDFRRQLGVSPHYMSASTPVIDGDLVFVVTSNGIREGGGIPSPSAPSFVAVDKHDGTVVWSDASASSRLVDGQWSSPVVGELGGRPQVVFAGGDGWLYGFERASGRGLWSFDGNGALGVSRERDLNSFVATPVLSENRIYIAMGRDPEVGSAAGVLWALEAPAAGAGRPTVAWRFPAAGSQAERFGRAIATVALYSGIVFAADLDGFVVALDEASGELLWRWDALAPIWASPTVIDERLYIADTDGEVVILAAGPELEVLAEVEMGAPIYRAPVTSRGVLFLMTSERLYAIQHPGAPRN